jgi:WD40 repeat protein
VFAGLVGLLLAGCITEPEPTRLDGNDQIVEPTVSSAAPPGPEFDLARRRLAGAQLTRDGKYQARLAGDWVVVSTADGAEFDRFATGPEGARISMDFSPDGRYLAVGLPDSVVLYDFTTKDPTTLFLPEEVRRPEGEPQPGAGKLRFSADSGHLVVELFDERANSRYWLYDLVSRREIVSPLPPSIEVPSDPGVIWYVAGLTVVDGGKRVVIAGREGFLVWVPDERTFQWRPCACGNTLSSTVDRQARHVAFLTLNDEVVVWDPGPPQEVGHWKVPAVDPGAKPAVNPTELEFTEDGRWLLAGPEYGHVWSVPDGKLVGSWQGSGS